MWWPGTELNRRRQPFQGWTITLPSLEVVAEAEKSTSPDTIFSMPFNNKMKDILKIAENVLGAQIAVARKDNASAISMLREAVTVQDSLKYGETPDWFFPVRESLGAVLLMNGVRSLFGLHQALKDQDRNSDSWFVEKQFRDAWKGGDGSLKLDELV
jgi:hypothetical protein